jgi:hypothetical protein
MVLTRILIVTILQFTCVYLEKVQNDFKVSKNQSIDLTASEKCLISSVYKSSRMTCMGSCNSNPECRTVVYNRNKGINSNCFFYNRYFDSSEMMVSNTSTVYQKKLGSHLIKTNFFKFNLCYY